MIYTDMKQINTDKSNGDLMHSNITYDIRGALFHVYNSLGFGHKEDVYQKALAKQFTNIHLPYEEQIKLTVMFENESVGYYKPDFVIDKKVIVELKAVEIVPKAYETQLLHYLKTTGYNLGLLVNFGTPTLYIKRLIWTNPRKSVINQRES